MRQTLKVVLPLIVSVITVSLLFTAYQVRREKRELQSDLSHRAEVLAENLQDSVEPIYRETPDRELQRLIDRFIQREHPKGVVIYNAEGEAILSTPGLNHLFEDQPDAAIRAAATDAGADQYLTVHGAPFHVYALPLHRDGEPAGELALIHDTGYIDVQVSHTLRDNLINGLIETLLISGLAIVLVRWQFMAPLSRTAQWLRSLRTGQARMLPPKGAILDELQVEVTHLARDLSAARATAEEEARLRDSSAAIWTAERLRVSLRSKFEEKALFVVSNREPYMHIFNGNEKAIQMIVPASGVVTALEPVLVACAGTWIANGSGNADRAMVDAHDHLAVPPERPSYTLRRVWLTPEEEKGYYEGFSNEGLWPLCHIAHTRPIFRPADWAQYQEINHRFARIALQEMAETEAPILLVQDYHFALLPRIVKQARPDARVAIFWHIPWPNAEIFGICPWQRELVDGLLGADLIGFHIQTHCNNFLETVDHAVEALTEWDRFNVNRQGHVTRVRPYPISVEFPESPDPADEVSNPGKLRTTLCNELGIEASLLGVGVDRIDYTKGILERFSAIERFFDLTQSYRGRFTFIQIGAPSRTDISAYQQFVGAVTDEASRINARFQTGLWRPIVFLKRHHSHEEIRRYYRAASVCMVTSLHDGMNLVAKEFVAARDDERGALILSTFAGAAQELSDALLVNPYDVRQLAEAIRIGLDMSEEQQALRMRHMRHIVREHNVFRWAASLLSDATDIRIDTPERVEAPQP
jgi:trehalose-6-phosphate synthase